MAFWFAVKKGSCLVRHYCAQGTTLREALDNAKAANPGYDVFAAHEDDVAEKIEKTAPRRSQQKRNGGRRYPFGKMLAGFDDYD